MISARCPFETTSLDNINEDCRFLSLLFRAYKMKQCKKILSLYNIIGWRQHLTTALFHHQLAIALQAIPLSIILGMLAWTTDYPELQLHSTMTLATHRRSLLQDLWIIHKALILSRPGFGCIRALWTVISWIFFCKGKQDPDTIWLVERGMYSSFF